MVRSRDSATIEKIRSRPGLQGHRIAALLTRRTTRTSLAKAVREHRPDVAHTFLPGCIADAVPVIVQTRPQTALVAGIRGATPDPVPVARRFLRLPPLEDRMRAGLALCDAAVVNAPHLVDTEAVRLGMPADKVVVIPNGLALPDQVADPGAVPPHAIVIANFYRYKGHHVLIRALAGVPEPLTITFCGVGPALSDVTELAATIGVADRITVADPPADVPAELARSQFGIHPSLTEGLSNAILEELAMGLPVVATDVGGAALQIDDGVNGFLIPPDDERSLTTALRSMASDPDRRVAMGAAARAKAEQFSWPICVASHIDLYSRLVAPR